MVESECVVVMKCESECVVVMKCESDDGGDGGDDDDIVHLPAQRLAFSAVFVLLSFFLALQRPGNGGE